MMELKTATDVLNALADPNVTARLTVDLLGKTGRELMRQFDGAYELPAAELFATYSQIHSLASRLMTVVVNGDAERIADRMRSIDSIRLGTTTAAAFEVVARRIMTSEQIAQITAAQR